MPGPFAQLATPEKIARRADLEVLYSRDLKTSEFASRMTSLQPDIILVAGFHRLIPPAIYSQARLAAINFHPSLLPHHRGGTPNRWVVRNGESRTGITAHLLSDSFDTGDIVGQCEIAVAANDTWGELEIRIAERMVPFVREIIDLAGTGQIKTQAQDPGEGSYEHSYSEADRIIDWRLPADEVRRVCFAIRPKSGGITWLSQKRLCLWDLCLVVRETMDAAPGTIIAIEANDEPVVACGNGAARLLQFVNRNSVIDAAKMRRAVRWEIGNRFEAPPSIQPQWFPTFDRFTE